jgi:hypothetical protein
MLTLLSEPLLRFAFAMTLKALIVGAQNTVFASVLLLSARLWKYLWDEQRMGNSQLGRGGYPYQNITG